MRDLRILIIDDEPAIARALRPALQAQGFTVNVAASGAEALAQLESAAPDLILLDLGLPDVDGVTLLQQIQARLSVPVIVLSVRGADRDKISALDSGADDYLTKPFSMGELLARIRVALRHVQQTPVPAANRAPIIIGAVVLDPQQHTVTAGGQAVHLSPTEFNLLEILMTNAGKVSTHRTLLHKVWGPEYVSETQLLRVYISQLRGKIEDRPDRPTYILTEPGIGYRFRDSE